jgi:hypothetical protein
VQNGPAKMAASATTTRISYISVMYLHGSVAGPGGCSAGRVMSHEGGEGGNSGGAKGPRLEPEDDRRTTWYEGRR